MRWRRVLAGLVAAVCAAFVTETVTAGPAWADQEPTSVSLTPQSGTAYLGYEDQDVMRVDVYGGDGGGSFGVRLGSTWLCSGAVGNYTGTCSIPASQLAVGTYSIWAYYTGDENSSAAASSLVTLTVEKQTSSNFLSLYDPNGSTVTGDPMLVYGSEQWYSFGGAVLAAHIGKPTGTVTITDTTASGTTTLCSGPLDSTGSIGYCGLGATTLPVGSNQITSTYGGDANFTGSSTQRTITVLAVQPTTTAVTLSAASVPYDAEQTEVFTAKVTPSTSGTPTGKVTIATGTTAICTITLSGGTGTCKPSSGSLLRPGTYPITATYSGDATNTASSDTSQTLTVAKEPTTTLLTLSADTVAVGAEDAEVFTVEVLPATAGTPTGNVTIKAGAVAICTISLATNVGCSPKPSLFKVGTYQITATYNGDGTYATSISNPAQTLNVVELLNRRREL
ncbi:Ig-like domain-containing protein [Actinoplanes sp. NPDC051851]|uniref:Ig-like domain-containing protein n=1 Tax=Actinoplanes sp. NPDC051851 TaxID=3154753 RepID=UPI00343CACE2